jgi:large subunit ribosomal protein L3
MMNVNGMIAKKVGMTRMFDAEGNMCAVTLLQIENQKVTKILKQDKDGYEAVQVGYYIKPEHRLNKPDLARLRKAGINENYSKFQEIRANAGELEGVELGLALTAESFAEVKSVDVSGVTKGRGFTGAVARWGAKTGRRTHGSHFHRRPGSLGQCTTPGRVYKNKHMPGHHGNAAKTVQNLRVLDVDTENNVIAVAGSVAGHRDGFVYVRPTVKGKKVKTK